MSFGRRFADVSKSSRCKNSATLYSVNLNYNLYTIDKSFLITYRKKNIVKEYFTNSLLQFIKYLIGKFW